MEKDQPENGEDVIFEYFEILHESYADETDEHENRKNPERLGDLFCEFWKEVSEGHPGNEWQQ